MRITDEPGVDVVGAGLRRRPRLSDTPHTRPSQSRRVRIRQLTRYPGDRAFADSARSVNWWRTALVMALTGHDHPPGLTAPTTRST
ncbi:hypothetical protein ABT143_12905 [Streptomyces sp. NPDC002033]|uniref:hypothetical protein n=1 Tax=unclassified Streptomyces TaxID=2593676 RepID=UPI003332CD23